MESIVRGAARDPGFDRDRDLRPRPPHPGPLPRSAGERGKSPDDPERERERERDRDLERERGSDRVTRFTPLSPAGGEGRGEGAADPGRAVRITLPLVALVLAACAGRTAVHPRADEQIARGFRYVAAGDLERAEVAFEHALAFSPDLPEALNGLGIVARTREDLPAARARFERAIRVDPDFAEGHANLGETLLALGRAGLAEAALARALSIDPDLADARQNLARALIRRALDAGEDRSALRARARREVLHLLESDPDRAAAHHDLAYLDLVAGRLAAAEAGYRRAAELAPGSRDALHGLCVSLVRLGRCAEGARACEACLAAAPGADACRVSLRGARACAE
jgi:Tfp pilus assembly protein PilF